VFYFGQCFRYERPQSGRYREFFQFGAELIGAPNPESDAEVIGLAAAMITRSGLGNFSIRVGHIGILRSKLSEGGVKSESAPAILQKLDKKVYDEAVPLMQQAGMSDGAIEDVVALTKTIGGIDVLQSLTGEPRDYLMEVFQVLQSYGLKDVKVDLGVVRGLDYYTGIVFEVDAPMLGAEKQVCGGGSYSLTELFGGEKTFSTGFAIGFDRILLALEREGMKAPQKNVIAYVVPVSETMRLAAFKITADLRSNGISTDVDLMRRNLGKNFKYADAIGAKFVIIVGEKEAAQDSVTVRDLKTGEQRLVRRSDLSQVLKE
jgi:histidyl-tRNA synthetase